MDRRHVNTVSVHVLLHNVAHLCNFEIRVTEYLCVLITTPGHPQLRLAIPPILSPPKGGRLQLPGLQPIPEGGERARTQKGRKESC